MSDTPVSLLQRLRQHSDTRSWDWLIDTYTPLIRSWLHRAALQTFDVDDLAQEVLGVVVRDLPQFQHNGRVGAFRKWLRLITLNRLRDFTRSRQSRPLVGGDALAEFLDQLEDPDSEQCRQWDHDHDHHVIRQLLKLVEPAFHPTTWQAFVGQVLEGRSAEDVATSLGATRNAVVIAKCRVLKRLRQEARELIDA